MRVESAIVPFVTPDGQPCGQLRLQRRRGRLSVIDADEAAAWAEEPVQLTEDSVCEVLAENTPPLWRLREEGPLIPSAVPERRASAGTLELGRGAGLLRVFLEDVAGTVRASAALEVVPSKLGYRDDYRAMLQEIAERCTDLVLSLRAPQSGRLVPDLRCDPQTLLQRFALVRGLLDTPSMRAALDRVAERPHRRLIARPEERPLAQGGALSSADLRRLAHGVPRVALPDTHPRAARLPTVPARTAPTRHEETIDTPENRFVRHALTDFAAFLQQVEARLGRTRADERLRQEAIRLRQPLERVLSGALRTVGDEGPRLPESPVLRQGRGYREIVRGWLRLQAAGRLSWAGGPDVYAAGRRDVATLYEYWIFLSLAECVRVAFGLTDGALRTLLVATADGFGLALAQGTDAHIAGTAGRWQVHLSFNRTFLPEAGESWTRRMRPDATLTLADTAGTYRLHFDAKYRAENGDLVRDDLVQMHAYRDALPGTVAALVLYTGSETRLWTRPGEPLPALGALPLRPGVSADADRAALVDLLRTFATGLASA